MPAALLYIVLLRTLLWAAGPAIMGQVEPIDLVSVEVLGYYLIWKVEDVNMKMLLSLFLYLSLSLSVTHVMCSKNESGFMAPFLAKRGYITVSLGYDIAPKGTTADDQ